MSAAADRTGDAAMENEHPETPGERTLSMPAIRMPLGKEAATTEDDVTGTTIAPGGSESTEPAELARVAGLGVSDKPAESVGRTDPIESGGSPDPADFDTPAEPAEPAEPVRPERPTGSEDSTGSEDPVEPEDPVAQPPLVEAELPAETVRVLTRALAQLRESVLDLRFGLDLPGAEEARQARAELLAQLEDYVIPRVRVNGAPALIVVAGSTGAGKSTLVNSLAEKNVSRIGVRRPTTGTPVLVGHPADLPWFAESGLLGGLERVVKPAQETARASLVVAEAEQLPQGAVLLDTPDIDSVVEEHHGIARRMLDAADIWIFVTTAARYADAPAWRLLRLARERGVRLAIVLSRVPSRARETITKHFDRMLNEYGLGEVDRFVIEESTVTDGRLPDSEPADLRVWLTELSTDEPRRARAVRQTLTGVLDSFRTRVPALARQLEAQIAFRGDLRADIETAYASGLTAVETSTRDGSLLRGEALARWQDFAGSGDLLRSIHLRGRARRQTPERLMSFKSALRVGLESLIVSAAAHAAEEVAARWRGRAELGATLVAELDRPSAELARRADRAVSAWQEHVTELIRTEGVAKRSVSKVISFDPDALSLTFTVGLFGGTSDGVPQKLVNALLGAESLRAISAKSLSDLRARVSMLFDEEAMRYMRILDAAGVPDEMAATRLYQATYNLEVAR